MWFDSSSIANLAKNALKEGKNRGKTLRSAKLLRGEFHLWIFVAQKHIDNVLDIKEDESEAILDDPKIVKSKTLPLLQEAEPKEQQDSVWGSFNGSFFENKATTSPITNAPPRKKEASSGNFFYLIAQ